MNFSQVFLNETGRVRSGWRFSSFVVTFLFGGIVLGTAVQSVFLAFPGASRSVFFLVNSLVSLVVVLILGWLFGKLFEDLPFKALGATLSDGWLRHLMVGCVLGALTLIAAVSISSAIGSYSFVLNASPGWDMVAKNLAVSLLTFGAGAAFEEALFRGYMLQTFARSGLSWLAIAITAIFFGIVHTTNPGANAISTLNTALAGVWFGVAYLKTRDLWFPLGIHLMWNWTQGSIFGIEVSGLKDISDPPLLLEVDRGPAWITGGDYGIEAAISTTVAILISIALIYYLPFLKADDGLVELTSKENPIRSTGS